MIYFYNPGEIDIAGATVAGLSAKTNESPIGYFGTGLKYSISCILRWGGKITIYSGETPYTFYTETIDFRGKEFDQVRMKNMATGNDIPLGFTTEYGKNWIDWQVFRELYSNAIDEGGGVTNSIKKAAAGTTLICVICKEIEDAYLIRDNIILPKHMMPAVENSTGRIYNKPSTSLYYRGICVADADSMYTYDISAMMRLTEDRTIDKFTYTTNLGRLVMLADDEEMIYNILTRGEGIEKDVSINNYSAFSREFFNVAKRIYSETPNKYMFIRSFLKQHDQDFTDIEVVEITGMRRMILDKAIRVCKTINEFPDNFPPIGVANLGRETLGLYEPGKNRIWIDCKAFDKGSKYVTSTLYEELTHWHTGYDDCNYTMQTHLFDKIISLYEEHVIKEPI